MFCASAVVAGDDVGLGAVRLAGMNPILCRPVYEEQIASTRVARMKWWREARFGMFIHYGLHSVLGRNEWAMALENWQIAEYEKLAGQFTPRRGCAREWVALAKSAGMKYAVLTTRHHEGFSLWDSKANPYNVVNCCPGGYDVVREFVEACREAGLRVGLYFSLMDWHHPDGWRCTVDLEARTRFQKFLKDMVVELLGGAYGKIDILWYDVSQPLESHEGWDSLAMNQLARSLQPDVLINDRACIKEDFSTPEGHLTAAEQGRAWESCMTFNDISWGYLDPGQVGPYSYNAQRIIKMVHRVAEQGGNLLLNIGPRADGALPGEAVEPLKTVGRWLSAHADAVYGELERCNVYCASGCGAWTRRGNTYYFWQWIWSGEELILGGFASRPKAIRALPGGESLAFTQNERQIVVKRPAAMRDPIANITVLELEFEEPPVFHPFGAYPQLHGGRQWIPGV
jgi:alpha-L-fucosidase